MSSTLAQKARIAAPQGMAAFTLIWFGQIISLIGSGMTCFAQSVWVYTDMGQSIANLGLLAVVAQLPGILLSPIAGVIADRWDRRWMMVTCDTVAALGTFTLRTLIVTHTFQLWHIFVIVVVISIANHFQWPAYFASVSMLVPRKQLGNANGMIAMGRALGQIVAPFMAGVAVTLFRIEGVILFDLATYVFAMVTLIIVRIPKPEAGPEAPFDRKALWREITFGWKYLAEHSGLLAILVIVSGANFVLGAAAILNMPLALSMSSVQVYGVIASMGGISMLVGGVIMSMWGGPRNRMYGMLGFAALQGIAIMIGGLRPSIVLLFFAVILFDLISPIVNACGQVIWQTKVPTAFQGRVLGACNMATAGAMQLGILAVMFSADKIFIPLLTSNGSLASSVGLLIGVGPARGLALMFILLGLFYTLITLGACFYPRIRFLDRELMDVALPSSHEGIEQAAQAVKATVYEV